MERCDKAPMGLECIDKLGHAGKCSCIKTEVFNAALQDAEDEFLWGVSQVVLNAWMAPNDIKLVNAGNGDFDPADLMRAMRKTGKAKTACMILDYVGNVDPADELAKVWDALHAAGINGAGGMSAAEGVALLARNYSAARDRRNSITLARDLLHKASVALAGKGFSATESPRVDIITYLDNGASGSSTATPCQHDWMFVEALNKMCCTQCEATRSAV